MSNFPLYDNLLQNISQRDLTKKQKEDLIDKIKKIDEDGAELIYALIRVYQMENSSDQSTFKLPFGGIYVGNDMQFNLEQLPNRLKQILHKFIQVRDKAMEEEIVLQENRT